MREDLCVVLLPLASTTAILEQRPGLTAPAPEDASNVRPSNRYVIALGRRVLAAWSSAAATRARRRAGTAAMVAAVSSILTRGAYRRWVSQAASATVEISNNITAFEHSYDRCLRGHLRAWSGLVKERRILRRGVDLLLHGRRVAVAAAGLRQWQRGTAEARNAALRQCRIKVRSCPLVMRKECAIPKSLEGLIVRSHHDPGLIELESNGHKRQLIHGRSEVVRPQQEC